MSAAVRDHANVDAILHAGAATALGATPLRISTKTGLPLAAASTLLEAGRVQGRLSTYLLGGTRSTSCAVPGGFFAPSKVLDLAVWYAGAAFAAEALSKLVTPASRKPVMAWLPEGAWKFALVERKRGHLRPVRNVVSRDALYSDGSATAKAWLDGAVPADAARAALRWDCLSKCPRPASPQVLADLFERAIEAATTDASGVAHE